MQSNKQDHPARTALAVGALGVVFGDIGTSPLYTLKTVLDLSGGGSPQAILGVVSLLTWTLIIVTSVKYAGFAMSIGNDDASVPRVAGDHRLGVTQIAPGYWAAHACYGFMERPDLPQLMTLLAARGCAFDPARLTYFVGSERITAREDGRGLPRWMEVLFSAMLRNSVHLTDYLRVPREQLIDLGRQISV